LQVLRLVELILRAEPNAAPLLRPIVERVIVSVIRAEALPMLLSLQLSVLARLLLGVQSVLADAVTAVGASMGETTDGTLQRLLDVWLDKMGLITQPERRKLLALALITLLAPDERRFCGLILAVSEVI
jgi:hypothetical protein